MAVAGQPDGIDKIIGFLQKREGIDKTLKLIRYTSRLVAALSPKDSETHQRYAALEKSVGLSRKAFRLGKFLQDYNNFRKSRATGGVALLELVAYGGEGIYYFIEQIVWLIKAGALDKAQEAQLSAISAWAELLGYAANIWLSLIKLRGITQEVAAVRVKLQKEEGTAANASTSAAASTSASASTPSVEQLHKKLAALAAARQLRVLAIIQDLADSSLALNDVRGGRDALLGHPVTLALAGLVSGLISAHKNWNS